MRGKERCEFCCYWKLMKDTFKIHSEGLGSCRKKAPVIIKPDMPILSIMDITFFPVTRGDDWCGDYK